MPARFMGDTMSNPKRRRSENIVKGAERAPNRSMYYGLGYVEADFDKPMVGIANGHSTITPCNSGLQRLEIGRASCRERVNVGTEASILEEARSKEKSI